MRSILIGNLISAAASVFLGLSCCVNDRRRAYFYQVLESALLVVSSVFFLAWVRLITQALAVERNLLVMKNRFTGRMTVLFSILAVGIGLAVNTEGLLGLMPIAATVQLTLCNYYCTSIRATKLGFLANVVLWGVYSFWILDFASGAAQVVIGVISLVSLRKLARRETTAA